MDLAAVRSPAQPENALGNQRISGERLFQSARFTVAGSADECGILCIAVDRTAAGIGDLQARIERTEGGLEQRTGRRLLAEADVTGGKPE